MGIPATRFVSELVDDSGLGGWVSTQHDKVLILADSRGLQITPSSQPYHPLQKNCNTDFTIAYSE